MYENELQQLGLTKGEAKVYESLLILGSSTVGPIVKKADIAYSNIYEVLSRLTEKGLVSFTIKEKTKYFQAVEPIRIKDYLDKQEEELQKSKYVFGSLLTQLNGLKNTAKKEETEIFFGERGVMTAYEHLLSGTGKNDEGVFFYVHNKEYYAKSEKFYVRSWALLKRYSKKWKGISNESFKDTALVKGYPGLIEQRYVAFPLPGNIDIIKDKTLITVWRNKPFAILIQSEEVADNFRDYFYSIWGKN